LFDCADGSQEDLSGPKYGHVIEMYEAINSVAAQF
jgi:hypothetical protein